MAHVKGAPSASYSALKADRKRGFRHTFRRNRPLYLMLLPGFVGIVLFNLYPMYGVLIAFQNYNPLLGVWRSPFVGLDNFRMMFGLPDFWNILRNTLAIAVGKIVVGQSASLVFALLLHEVRVGWFRRSVQSFSYLPHFLSWIIFGGILIDILALRGVLNNALAAIGLPRVFFLGNANLFQPTMVMSDVWKEFGFGAVIYLAALTGIDPTLYEAAAVDGANRRQRMWYITLPGIAATIILLATLSLGSVLNAGFEQILVLYNPAVYRTGDIIDTYVYRAGLLEFQYSLATAVGLLKGVVSLVLISLSFFLAERLANYRIL